MKSLSDDDLRFLLSLPVGEAMVGLLEQWAMNDACRERLCTLTKDKCLSWVMRNGAKLIDELKYNLMWVMKDLISGYDVNQQWAAMTADITPWETSEIVLIRILEQEEVCWLPFVAASLSSCPKLVDSYFASLQNHQAQVVLFANCYLTMTPLLANPNCKEYLTDFLNDIITFSASGTLPYDLSLSLLGLFSTVEKVYGRDAEGKTILGDVWTTVCDVLAAVLQRCQKESIWPVFGRSLEFLFQVLFSIVDADAAHLLTNWSLITTYWKLIQVIPSPSTRNMCQVLLQTACDVLESGRESIVCGQKEEEDLLSFGAKKAEPEAETTSKPTTSLSTTVLLPVMEQLVDRSLDNDLRFAAPVLTCLRRCPCLNDRVLEVQERCDAMVRSLLAEVETKSKKRWNVDRKKDEMTASLCPVSRCVSLVGQSVLTASDLEVRVSALQNLAAAMGEAHWAHIDEVAPHNDDNA